MKYTLLAAVASAAFMASGVLAQAQENPRQDEKPGAEKSEVRPMVSPKAQQREEPRAAQADQRQDEGAAPAEPREAPRAAQMDQRNDQGAAPKRTDQAQEKRPVERAQNGAERPDQRSAERPEQRKPVQTGANERRGEPRIIGRVQTSPEHASRVTDILTRNSRSENVNIEINIGMRVPESVTMYPVPEEVLTFAPEYEGYDYFVDNGEVVFVAPSSHEIVAAIDYEGRAAAVDQTTRVAGARPCPVEN